jgi:hypothetical protein
LSKKNFFISYTKKNEDWAEWIAWQLEEAGYTVTLQAWDFKSGGNFVNEMQNAVMQAERTIAILSPEYMKSGFAGAEWNAAFAKDPLGKERKLITIRIADFKPEGLLGQIRYIDLVGLDHSQAIKRLLDEISASVSKEGRLKPSTEPKFPGGHGQEPPFPSTSKLFDGIRIPDLKRITDMDKIQFMEESYTGICSGLEKIFEKVKAQNPNFSFKVEKIHLKKTVFRLFVDQNLKLAIKIWLGSMNSSYEQINFWFGHWVDTNDNSMNETLICDVEDNKLRLKMTMNLFGDKNANDVESIIKEIWEHHIVSSLR